MLAPIPPRRTTRSSTRNDSDTLCNWSGSSCSANRPGKCMRWSVAIEPVTAIFISGPWGTTDERPAQPTGNEPPSRPRGSRGLLVEGVAAGAGALRVGVVDGEALGVDPVREVDRRAAQVRGAHPVHDDLDGRALCRELGHHVAVERALVEEELVAQARAAAGLDGHAQPQIVPALLVEQPTYLLRGDLGEDDGGRLDLLGRRGAFVNRGGHGDCSLARVFADVRTNLTWPRGHSHRPTDLSHPRDHWPARRLARAYRPSAGRVSAWSRSPKWLTNVYVSVTPAAAASRRPALAWPASTRHGRPRSRAPSATPATTFPRSDWASNEPSPVITR